MKFLQTQVLTDSNYLVAQGFTGIGFKRFENVCGYENGGNPVTGAIVFQAPYTSANANLATTVVSETTYGIAVAVGTGTAYARNDHTHGSQRAALTPVTATNAGTVDCTATMASAATATMNVVNGNSYLVIANGIGQQITAGPSASKMQIIDGSGIMTVWFFAYSGTLALSSYLPGTGYGVYTATSTKSETFSIQGAASAGALRFTAGNAHITVIDLGH